MNIAENLQQVLSELPDGVRLVAVSKFHPNEAIEEAYRTGQRIFGERQYDRKQHDNDCEAGDCRKVGSGQRKLEI